jgi:hypothetical protein
MWFKGVLTSEKLGTLIDSKLLIHCLQADYILGRILVCISKTPLSLKFTPLLLSTMVATSLMSSCHCVLWTQLPSVVAAPQPLEMLLWFVYTSPQSIVDQLSSLQGGVNQLSSELGGSHSELCLLSAFRLPSVSVPDDLLSHCLSNKSLWHLFGTCLIIGLP